MKATLSGVTLPIEIPAGVLPWGVKMKLRDDVPAFSPSTIVIKLACAAPRIDSERTKPRQADLYEDMAHPFIYERRISLRTPRIAHAKLRRSAHDQLLVFLRKAS